MGDNIYVRPIENGYIVSYYKSSGSDLVSGKQEEWYCIDINEVNQRVEKLLLG